MITLFVITSIISLILSAIGTYYLYHWAKRRGVFEPAKRERDLHDKPVPRVGGLAIVSTFTIVILVLNFIYPDLFATLGFPFKILGVSIDKRLLGILVAGGVLAIAMAIDDYRGLNAWVKLAIQALVWAIVIAAGIGLTYINNPFGLFIDLTKYSTAVQIGAAIYHIIWIADILFFIWLLGMINAVNFIDGVDGLAGGIGIIGFVVIGILSLMPTVNQPAVAMLAFVAAAATAGFLIFNFYPAKVFLGDAGAMWIGFMLAVLSVISGGKLATLFLVLAVVIIDGFIVVFGRVARGKNPLTTADQTHIHHRFIAAGIKMPYPVIAIYILSAAFGALALLTSGKIKWIAVIVLTVIIFAILMGVRTIAKSKLARMSNAK